MRVCKRIFAALALLLGTAGLLLSLAVGVGVWIVKEPATARAKRLFERIEAKLDVADQGLDHVKTSLARAAERLDAVKEEQQKLAREPRRSNTARRLLARTVQQRIAPELGDASMTLTNVAEAALVINSVLEDVGNLPFLSTSGLDVGQLTQINGRISQAATSAWELSRLLGETGDAPDDDAASTQLSRTEQTLKSMRGLIDEYESRVREVRPRIEELRSKTLFWITPASVLISFVCFWIALSQVSLLAHAWSWWKDRGHNPRRLGDQ